MPETTTLRFEVDERRAARVPTHMLAELRCDQASAEQVIITDMTNYGCRVTVAGLATIGTFVTIAIPDFVEIPGWVAWSTDTALGVDFSHPLPDAVRTHVVALGIVKAA